MLVLSLKLQGITNMNKILSMGLTMLLCAQLSYADDSAKSKVLPLSKSKFAVLNNDGTETIVDLAGQDYIVASLREKGADGAAYAIDSDGVIWWAAIISSGAKGHETPSGIF